MPETPPNSVYHLLIRDQWRFWLAENHQQTKNVWLITYKKAIGKLSFSYDAVVEEVLCFGWIDSLPRKLDDERKMLYFALRKSGSDWSRPNKERDATRTKRIEETARLAQMNERANQWLPKSSP